VPPELRQAQDELTEILMQVTAPEAGWRVLPSPAGVTLTRGWTDDSADTVIFVSPDSAYALRENSNGQEVWRIRGTARQVADALAELPAPGQPDGSDHRPGPNRTGTR
jgi:hypothetical protein